MHMTSRCIMCSDVDFLCKCLNLLYVIKGADFLWPSRTLSLDIRRTLVIFLLKGTNTPLITWCLLQYIRHQTQTRGGGSQPNITAACTKFIDWEVECCKREFRQGSVTGTPGRADLLAPSFKPQNVIPSLYEAHLYQYFFRGLKCSLSNLFIY